MRLKDRIVNEMFRGSDEADREEVLLSIISEYPAFNTPKSRAKIRRLYYKFRGGGKRK